MASVTYQNSSFDALSNLLCAPASAGADFILPGFKGGAALPDSEVFTYPGEVFAERDTKSAFYISNLISNHIKFNNINLRDTNDFEINHSTAELIFVFGSKSNNAMQNLITNNWQNNRFSLSFDENWTIHSNNSGKNYAIKDPSTLTRSDYEQSTDYGIIARFKNISADGKTAFIIAGLGSRATEGCGIFFANNWEKINEQFDSRSVAAVVLKFSPPVNPAHHHVAEWIL